MEKEQFDLEKSELQKSMEIADIFQNPLWDYIGCIFPIGGITATFRKQYENALEEKRRGFLKEICETSCCIVETDIRSFDYISDLKLGIDAIERVSFNEKIKFIANLFNSTHSNLDMMDSNEYQENLRKLCDLSLREIDILCMLHQNESGKNDAKYFARVHEKYQDLDTDEVNAMLLSLTKTGFCKETVATRLNYRGNEFSTTKLLERFLKDIGVEDNITKEFKGARRKNAEQEEIKNLVPEMKPMSNEQIDKIFDEIFYKDEL